MSVLSRHRHPGRKPPRVRFFAALVLMMVLWTSVAVGARHGFTKAIQADLDRDWAFTSMSWSLRQGALRDTGSSKSHAVLQKEISGDNIWAEAEIMVHGRTGSGWKVAGVSLYQDIRNYWHLALVESPGESGARSIELKLMGDGRWGAAGTEGWRSANRVVNPDARWLVGQKYRLKIEKQGSAVRGRVWDDKGGIVTLIEYQNVSDGLVRIYPAVDNGGFDASFLQLMHSKGLPESFGTGLRGQGKGSGFYSVVAEGGINWLLNPDGGKSLSIGCEWVKYREIWCQALGYSPYYRNAERLFGTEAEWARDVAGKLRARGFNTVGQSDRKEEISKQGLAFAPILRLGQGFSEIAAIVPKTFWTGFPDVFDQRFSRFCRMIAEMECRPWRDDPDLLGYYIDNELEWFGKDGKPWALFNSAMMLGPESPAKRAAVECLRKRYPAISEFNRAWQCSASSWAEMESPLKLPDPRTPEALSDADGFVKLCAERYFAITTAAIRRADPNHLVLGARFAWVAPEPAWREAGRNCDIVSFNCYPRIEMLSGEIPGLRDTIANRHSVCGRPLLISEWGFPALDAGLPSTKGAGMRVDDQRQRAYCAARFQEEVLSVPFVVGTSWFMWADEPALGVTDSFPENSNYGLVDVGHRPYLRVAAALASVHRKANDIHSGRRFSPTADSLRDGLGGGTTSKLEGPGLRSGCSGEGWWSITRR